MWLVSLITFPVCLFGLALAWLLMDSAADKLFYFTALFFGLLTLIFHCMGPASRTGQSRRGR